MLDNETNQSENQQQENEYMPLARPKTQAERLADLADYVQNDLRQQMDELITDFKREEFHKVDLHIAGTRGVALRIEISRKLAQANKLYSDVNETVLSQMHETKRATKNEEDKAMPVDVVKSRAKKRLAPLQEAIDLLKYAREDITQMLSQVQTGMRTLKEDEVTSYE